MHRQWTDEEKAQFERDLAAKVHREGGLTVEGLVIVSPTGEVKKAADVYRERRLGER